MLEIVLVKPTLLTYEVLEMNHVTGYDTKRSQGGTLSSGLENSKVKEDLRIDIAARN